MQIAQPETVGLSSERLDRINTVMQGYVENNQMPGIMTVVQRRGKVVHCGLYGMMDIEAQKPMREDAIFRMYSMTKPVTSIALMMLFEEGRCSLNDPVAKYLPMFKQTKVYDGMGIEGMKLVEQNPPMTIHHLLTHTAGLSYGWSFDSPAEECYRQAGEEKRLDSRDETLEQMAERFAQLPLLFQPGSHWRYSQATSVLGYVIEVIADMPFAEFLEERIFKPLGMVDTAFHVVPEKMGRLAQLYISDGLYDPYVSQDPPVVYDIDKPTLSPRGGSGMVSTAADYLNFCNCLIHGGAYEGVCLVSRKTLAWMTANHIPDALLPLKIGLNEIFGYGFGLGFRVMLDIGKAQTLTSVGEYGWSGLAKTYFWIDPQEDLIGLMMTQYIPLDPYPVQDRFRNLVYQALVD